MSSHNLPAVITDYILHVANFLGAIANENPYDNKLANYHPLNAIFLRELAASLCHEAWAQCEQANATRPLVNMALIGVEETSLYRNNFPTATPARLERAQVKRHIQNHYFSRFPDQESVYVNTVGWRWLSQHHTTHRDQYQFYTGLPTEWDDLVGLYVALEFAKIAGVVSMFEEPVRIPGAHVVSSSYLVISKISTEYCGLVSRPWSVQRPAAIGCTKSDHRGVPRPVGLRDSLRCPIPPSCTSQNVSPKSALIPKPC